MPFTDSLYEDGVIDAERLTIALAEVVPAAYHSLQYPLTPGSISARNKRKTKEDHFPADVFVKIEAKWTRDREANNGDRADHVRAGLEELFPGVSFDIWANLGTYAGSSNTKDPDFDGDMSMPAAIARATAQLAQLLRASELDRTLLELRTDDTWQPNIMDWQAIHIADELGITLTEVCDRLKELSDDQCRVISGR